MLTLLCLIMQQYRYKKYYTCWYFKLCIKTNLANLKTEVNKLDTDKIKTVHVDLSKLSNVVKNEVVKNDKLVGKVNNIDTSRFLLKTKYDTGKLELEKKIPNTSNLVEKKQITILKLVR